uniref:Thioredoxin n=1 Tax=Ditylum brightwellii TaxID=49249 RepID=A0A6U3R6W8_9STRA|mmetsp:Transcript_21823/g.31600  ORF Transcript_21823/g.31600 Transcript_21823/m.31600 type:complete len:106 (-) Transcript_21823:863-1180(-)
MVNYIKSKEEFGGLMETSKTQLVVIDFTASWCGPCQMIAPFFAEMAEKYPDVTFVKVDVDEADELAAACGISAMPTFQFYKNGSKVSEMKGANKTKLEQTVTELK